MPDPDRSPDPHPVPTQRRVFISALDQRYHTVPLETLLRERGFDLSQPWREETAPELGDGTLYVQDIPEGAA